MCSGSDISHRPAICYVSSNVWSFCLHHIIATLPLASVALPRLSHFQDVGHPHGQHPLLHQQHVVRREPPGRTRKPAVPARVIRQRRPRPSLQQYPDEPKPEVEAQVSALPVTASLLMQTISSFFFWHLIWLVFVLLGHHDCSFD